MRARSDRTVEQLQGWLSALTLVGAAVNRGVSLDELLNLVAKTACNLMFYDFCSVTLPGPGSQVLTIQGSHGLSAEYIKDVNALHPDRLRGASLLSPSSQAFKLGIPIQVGDTATNPSFAPWAAAARNQGYTSVIAVPLIAAGEILGTLNCYTRLSHHFHKDEESILTVLADQAAIAITTARLRMEQARAIAGLDSLNKTLEKQQELQRQDAEVHDRFTALALAGGDVAGIGAALADLLGQPVIISSQDQTVTCGPAFDSAPLLDLLTESIENQHLSSPMSGPFNGATDVLLSATKGPAVAAIRVPIVIREEVVACIWTTGSLTELSSVNRRAIEHAATVVALELLSVRTAAEAAWRKSGDVISGLLSRAGAVSEGIISQAASLGHDLSQPHAMIATRHDGGHDGGFQARLADTVGRLTELSQQQPLIGLHQEFVVTVWALGHKPLESARHVSEEIRRSLTEGEPSPGSALSVLTGPVTDPTGYPEAFLIARRAVELARLRGMAGQTLLVPDLGMAGLFLQIPDSSGLHSYCEEVLGPLRRYDDSHGATLVRTLSALVRNDLDASVTAEQLAVKTTTITRQRRLIEELLGHELTNVAVLTHVATALELEEVIAAARIDDS